MGRLMTRFIILNICLIVSIPIYAGQLDKAKEAYLYGDYNEAIRICLELVERNPEADALYFLGLSFFKLHEYDEARSYFRCLAKDFKNSKFFDPAVVKLIDTYFLEGDLEKAEALYKSALKKYPSTKYKPLIFLRLAQVSAKKGKWSDKHHYVRLIKNQFPNTLEERLAQRLEKRGDFFTIQVGAFSKKANASKFAKKFKSKYPVYIVTESEEDLVLYKVRVGKYRDRLEVVNIYHKLLEEGYPARIYP